MLVFGDLQCRSEDWGEFILGDRVLRVFIRIYFRRDCHRHHHHDDDDECFSCEAVIVPRPRVSDWSIVATRARRLARVEYALRGIRSRAVYRWCVDLTRCRWRNRSSG